MKVFVIRERPTSRMEEISAEPAMGVDVLKR